MAKRSIARFRLAALVAVGLFVWGSVSVVAPPGGKSPAAAKAEAAPRTASPAAGAAILTCVAMTERPATTEAAPREDVYSLPPGAVGVETWRLRYYCPGDFNKDNRVDVDDLSLYAAVYSVREGPMVDWLDVNRDGEITVDDLTEIIEAVQGGGCDPEQANYRVLIC